MKKSPGPYHSARRTAGQQAFLQAFRACGVVSHAAQHAGIQRVRHYDWCRDPEYVAAFRTAQEEAIDTLEREAWRRAVDGVKRPVYQGGKEVGATTEYSDHLLMFLLKGLKPDVYRENWKGNLTVKATPEPDPELDCLSDEDIEVLYAISRKANQAIQARTAAKPAKPQ
jgi:hypothetical protein